MTLDIDHWRRWIGRTETVEDSVTPRLLRDYAATMDAELTDTAPLALHWCLAPPAMPTSSLGPDGHPERGLLLPPVPLPRRMWAGGALNFHDRLRLGDVVRRNSRIADVVVKEGRSGTLCFVTLEHEVFSPRGLAISERQDVVYRDFGSAPATAAPAASREAEWEEDGKASTALLFRYSALTFNGHRIHYDRPYAMGVETYPGLLVHGPLQATWLLEFAAKCGGAAPVSFSFRGVSPLYDFASFKLRAVRQEGGVKLWVETDENVVTMEASASW
jgi:3-methylfumaryl-CoA hydratase